MSPSPAVPASRSPSGSSSRARRWVSPLSKITSPRPSASTCHSRPSVPVATSRRPSAERAIAQMYVSSGSKNGSPSPSLMRYTLPSGEVPAKTVPSASAQTAKTSGSGAENSVRTSPRRSTSITLPSLPVPSTHPSGCAAAAKRNGSPISAKREARSASRRVPSGSTLNPSSLPPRKASRVWSRKKRTSAPTAGAASDGPRRRADRKATVRSLMIPPPRLRPAAPPRPPVCRLGRARTVPRASPARGGAPRVLPVAGR